MMPVARDRQTEKRLQNPMDMRCYREILTPGHQVYALDGVVDRDCEVVARRELLAGQHDIAEYGGLRLPPAFSLDPVEWAGQRERACHVEPQRVINSRTNPCGGLSGSEPAAGAGIRRSGIAVRSGAGARDLSLDLAPCAKARVERTQRIEP